MLQDKLYTIVLSKDIISIVIIIIKYCKHIYIHIQ